MHIWLLTHSEELKKANGTGKLVKATLQDNCSVIVWQRTITPLEIAQLPVENTRLIYTATSSDEQLSPLGTEDNKIQHIIILDGTWQQARKMYNQSPYLKRFTKYEITGQRSEFTRRRNQLEHGLCTAETAVHLLRTLGQPQQAEQLYTAFSMHNQQMP